MSANGRPDQLSRQTAEDILRTIYGDDFKGCTVSLDSIAAIVENAARKRDAQNHELLELYEKLVEALHLLSTPPEGDQVKDPKELGALLSERLDAIHALTTKTMETTSRARGRQSAE